MNVYNPLDAMKRLEAAGLERRQAEAIASEINDGKSQLVTTDQLDTALDAFGNKLLVKIGLLIAGVVGLACTILGVLISFK